MEISPTSKKTIIDHLNQVYQLIYDQLIDVTPEAFQHEAFGKWSAALQLDHLIKSSKPVASALKLPKITFRVFGIPDKDSRSYEAIIAAYQEKLHAGGKASGKYIPSVTYTKEEQLTTWLKTGNQLADRIEKSWTEDQLDRYLMPHPLLGKLTAREMLFFTIYHTLHHHKSIAQLLDDYQAQA